MTLEEVHRKSFRNRATVLKAKQCGCFYCLETYPASALHPLADWCDGGQTARCPKCGVDSVVTDADAVPATLAAMRERWFGDPR